MTPHPLPVCSTHLGDARQPVCARTLTTHWLSGEVRILLDVYIHGVDYLFSLFGLNIN